MIKSMSSGAMIGVSLTGSLMPNLLSSNSVAGVNSIASITRLGKTRGDPTCLPSFQARSIIGIVLNSSSVE